MKNDDFLALSNGQNGKKCTVILDGNEYTGVFSGITMNVVHELCMNLTMDAKTLKIFQNVATEEGIPVVKNITIKVSAINILSFEK